MSQERRIDHKRGDTFEANCRYTDGAGTPINLTQITIRSQLKDDAGRLIEQFEVTRENQALADQVGRFKVRAEFAQTEKWPLKALRWDIQYTDGQDRTSTETVIVNVVQDITGV